MKPILILYATRTGHTRRIAEYIAGSILARGERAELIDAAHLPATFSMEDYSAAILAASVHTGEHEKEMIQFVRAARTELEKLPTVFLSVSLSEAGAEKRNAPERSRAQAAEDTHRIVEKFVEETGWHPDRIQAVAGALLYSRYNLLLRFIMARIARNAGADTDTSHDYVYTDWAELDQLADDVLSSATPRPSLASVTR